MLERLASTASWRERSKLVAYDAAGVAYEQGGTSGNDCKPAFGSKALRQGDTVSGWVRFLIPKATTGLSLKYRHQPKAQGGNAVPEQVPTFTVF